MSHKSADIIVVGFDGDDLRFYNVTDVSDATLQKLVPHLKDKEQRFLYAAIERGYSTTQQFIFAVTAENTFRTCFLMEKVTQD